MTQFISEIIDLIKTLNYRDFIKIILFLIILTPFILLWRTEEYLSTNNLPPQLIFLSRIQVDNVGQCRKWIIKEDNELHYSIDTNLVYRDEYEKRIVATFKYQPTTEQSKETCQKLIKASHSFDLKNSY